MTDRLADLAELVRLRILRLLEAEELSVGEVAKVVQLPQSTVSRHLKVLAEGGWVVRRTEGTATLYRVLHDDLPDEARAIWVAVREQLGSMREVMEDTRRLPAVLAERRGDSLAFFGRVAGEWDDLRNNLFGSEFTARALVALAPAWWTVADLGCGTGNASELLAPHVERVIAVDQSEPMLEAARKRLAGSRNVDFRPGALESLPIDDASVDAAVCVLVLHHVDDPERALAEMRRVLRAPGRSGVGGGVALVVDMLRHDRAEYRYTMGHRHLGFEPREMERMLRSAGFSSARVRELPPGPQARGPGLFAGTAHVGGAG